VVCTVRALFDDVGSVVALLTVEVLLILTLFAVAASALTTIVNARLAAAASDVALQLTVPLLPTAGLVQFHPDAPELETKCALDGSATESDGLVSVLGPLLVTRTT
jgi:hypothetical protein